MPRLQFTANIPGSLSLTEAQEMTEVLLHITDALRDYGHTITEQPLVRGGNVSGVISTIFSVQIGDDS